MVAPDVEIDDGKGTVPFALHLSSFYVTVTVHIYGVCVSVILYVCVCVVFVCVCVCVNRERVCVRLNFVCVCRHASVQTLSWYALLIWILLSFCNGFLSFRHHQI